jgi:hypothetical protein
MAADPGVVGGLAPSAGLQVTPALFQSIEQEGRWKPLTFLVQPASAARDFEFNTKHPSLYQFGGVNGQKYGQLQQAAQTLLTIKCSSGSQVVIDATWWYDELEIYAGFAGMASAAGFGSSNFNDTASISLQAISFGNYFPAEVLIVWTGWVNPTGTNYKEFRGGIVVNANGFVSTPLPNQPNGPPYMQAWDRGKPPDPPLRWSSSGFRLEVTSLLPSFLNPTGSQPGQ